MCTHGREVVITNFVWYKESIEKSESKALLAMREMNKLDLVMRVNLSDAKEYY